MQFNDITPGRRFILAQDAERKEPRIYIKLPARVKVELEQDKLDFYFHNALEIRPAVVDIPTRACFVAFVGTEEIVPIDKQ